MIILQISDMRKIWQVQNTTNTNEINFKLFYKIGRTQFEFQLVDLKSDRHLIFKIDFFIYETRKLGKSKFDYRT